jgi:hypothetical protein
MAHLINVPSVTCGNGLHVQLPEADPVFHFVQSDGHHGVAGLDTVKAWARDIRDTGTPLYMIVSDLYILLPNTSELIRCLLVATTGDDGPEMEVVALRPTALESNTLYTCKI